MATGEVVDTRETAEAAAVRVVAAAAVGIGAAHAGVTLLGSAVEEEVARALPEVAVSLVAQLTGAAPGPSVLGVL